jgi:hypothetical protein
LHYDAPNVIVVAKAGALVPLLGKAQSFTDTPTFTFHSFKWSRRSAKPEHLKEHILELKARFETNAAGRSL